MVCNYASIEIIARERSAILNLNNTMPEMSHEYYKVSHGVTNNRDVTDYVSRTRLFSLLLFVSQLRQF